MDEKGCQRHNRDTIFLACTTTGYWLWSWPWMWWGRRGRRRRRRW